MNCPICTDTQLVMADRQGVEIDYCPKCRGIWLDRGELDKIIERSATLDSDAAPTQQIMNHQNTPHQQRYHHDKDRRYNQDSGYGHPYRKKKSLLSELFDFD